MSEKVRAHEVLRRQLGLWAASGHWVWSREQESLRIATTKSLFETVAMVLGKAGVLAEASVDYGKGQQVLTIPLGQFMAGEPSLPKLLLTAALGHQWTPPRCHIDGKEYKFAWPLEWSPGVGLGAWLDPADAHEPAALLLAEILQVINGYLEAYEG